MPTPEVRGELAVGDRRVSTATVAPPEAFAALAVAHGAGAGMDHPFMAGFCRAIGELGVATLRFNFPYLERGRRSPDPEPVLRAAWLAAFDETRRRSGGVPVLAGGKSLGGRIASMCVADGMPAAGLVFLGYPLHPPGRPQQIRAEHLYRVHVPMLFLHGTADPFGRPEVLRPVLDRLGALAEDAPVEGGGHSFEVRGRKEEPRDVGAGLAGAAAAFARRVAGAG